MTRDFLTVTDLSAAELARCLKLAAQLKRSRTLGQRALAGQTLALIFHKPSVRTRVSFQVAAAQLGGSSIYLATEDIQLGKREPMQDVARTLSRYVRAIVVRTFSDDLLEQLAGHATVPVINALTDRHHPCQALADVLTIQEQFGKLKGLTIAYVGDGNNVLHSLAQAAALLGINLRAATPKGYAPDAQIWNGVTATGKAHGATMSLTERPEEAARGAHVIYTDVWTSMGQEHEDAVRQEAFRGFQINAALLAKADRKAIVLHCLPAHRDQEITDEVLEGPQSRVFDQAENRLHAQKALLMLLLGGKTLPGGKRSGGKGGR